MNALDARRQAGRHPDADQRVDRIASSIAAGLTWRYSGDGLLKRGSPFREQLKWWRRRESNPNALNPLRAEQAPEKGEGINSFQWCDRCP